MKPSKKSLFLVLFALAAVSGLVFATRTRNNETAPSKKPLSTRYNLPASDARKKWEASPEGIHYKAWENSPAGKKVQASYELIRPEIKAVANMEAVVTSTTFQREGKSASIKWLIVRINGEEYMMQFTPKDFQQLSSLKVNDKIIVRSRGAGLSPNHPFLILSADYIEHNKKQLFKREKSKNDGC